jgi:hypothetical protein
MIRVVREAELDHIADLGFGHLIPTDPHRDPLGVFQVQREIAPVERLGTFGGAEVLPHHQAGV